MKNKDYRLRDPIDKSAALELSSFSPLVQKLLFYREIRNNQLATDFLRPDYEKHTHNPFLLKDMERAISRILEAVKLQEKILIYSDYDADGIPGGVILREFFDKIGHQNVENYIPHRSAEGFGLNEEAVKRFKDSGVNLIITVDCGTADSAHIDLANRLGIDVIITDHHEPNGHMPNACAIINPKQKDCNYPDKNLCGSGVVYKLVQALASVGHLPFKQGQEKWFLDLVGMATISDMVPLIGENRTLAYYGLRVLRKTPRVGLLKLFRKLYISERNLTEDDVSFTLAQRINAASRMDQPMDAFKLLITKNLSEADAVSNHLNKINDERKGIVANLIKEIRHIVNEKRASVGEKEVIVVGNPKWRPALLGLAANVLVEDFNRPVFLWGRDGGSIKGSCRSEGVSNILSIMNESKDCFSEFGGHEFAGGFSIDNEKVHFLEDRLVEAYKKVGKEETEKIEWVDSHLHPDDANENLWRELRELAPFGVGNSKPLFLMENVPVKSVRQFGKDNNHLEISIPNSSGMEMKAVAFFSKPDSFKMLPEPGGQINLVAHLEKSFFQNRPELRLRIVDIV